MTLQERVLEALGERALTPKALYLAMSNDSAPAIDCALGALMRGNYVTFELGHYQRTKRKMPTPKSAPPLISNAGSVVAPITTSTPISALQPKLVPQVKTPPPVAPADPLTKREREIFDLIAGGLSNAEAGARLRLSAGCISYYLCTARKKLGIKVQLGARTRDEHAPKSAPSAAVQLSAEPSPSRGAEGSGPATVETKVVSFPVTKEELKPAPCRPTFSPGLIARLVEEQRSLAMSLQAMLDRVSYTRQRLADVEELVRIATTKDVSA